mgnify:CR=1 FL=1
MKALKQYLVHMNMVRTLHGVPVIDINNMSERDVMSIVAQLENDMSPENLHCDGELERSAVMIKKQYYDQVIADLASGGHITY